MMNYEGLSYIPLIVVTVLSFVLGGLWYSVLFGRSWLTALGKREDELGNAAPAFIISFFTGFVVVHTMALIINTIGITGAWGGFIFGLYVGVGLIAMSMAGDFAFNRFSRKLFLIEAGYRVVFSVLAGIILALWR